MNGELHDLPTRLSSRGSGKVLQSLHLPILSQPQITAKCLNQLR